MVLCLHFPTSGRIILSSFSHSQCMRIATLIMSCLIDSSNFNMYEVISHWGFFFAFSLQLRCQVIFIYQLAFCMSSLRKYLSMSYAYIFIVFVVVVVEFYEFFIYLGYWHLMQSIGCKYLLPFFFLDFFVVVWKLFSLM